MIFVLQFKPVQVFVSKKTASYLSKELNTTITLSSIYIKPFSSIVLKDLYIQDLEHDTLLYVDELSAKIDLRSIRQSNLILNRVQIKGGSFFLKKYTDETTNLTFIIDYFSTAEKEDQHKKAIKVLFPTLSFQDMEMRYRNYASQKVEKGVDFGDVSLYSLSGKLNNIDFENYLFKADVEALAFKEKSGLELKSLRTTAIIDSNYMEFSKLDLVMNNSHVRDYVRFDYDSFKDFSEFITNVKVIGELKNSKINSVDVAFFAPEVSITKFDVLITGHLSGTVENIHGRNIEMRAGKETWISGDLKIRGLPEIDNTLFDLELSRLQSTTKDLEVLIGQWSDNDKIKLPAVFERLGKIDYTGRITGFYNNFIAQGFLKTALGDLITDINLDIRGQGNYNGEVFSPSFDVGRFLQLPDVGLASFRAHVTGQGLTVEKLQEELKGNIAFIDYKGYRYKDIDVDGTYLNNVFSGDILIEDKNLVLDFNGNLNLSARNLSYDFIAHIDKINLKELNLYKDSLSLSGDIDANFTGNSFSTIDGKLLIENLSIHRPLDSTLVKSFLLYTAMEDSSRVLAIESDIANAKINGDFDLRTLPSYFKRLTKRYIPSLKTRIEEVGVQEFDFELELKDFVPIAMVFAPEVTIPDQVTVTGKFSTENYATTLTGFIPLITYKNVKLSNLIFDQTTGVDALNLFITADRIDITDSLYIQNINMATVLRHDSLNFNIKLSDLTAKNQLDLNGLVEFHEDVSARLSLLPSNVIINQENWKILDKVNFDIEKGKTSVNGLELSQGSQKVTINGILSKSEEDKLTIDFKDFLLSTVNSLTRPLGVDLEGELNGKVEINSLLSEPYISANIQTKDIFYNNTELGNLAVRAGWDRGKRLVDVDMDITLRGKKTVEVSGVYNHDEDTNPLDLKLRMDQGELVLFQPFLKNLVSELKGAASADMRVNGTLSAPSISGTIDLQDASFIVNYLKTRYRVNETVAVDHSKIILNNLRINDDFKNQAVANGTVDMSTPLNPDIQVDVKATDFMVLNTTAKDNPLYYGKAYGTGTFTFHGPTDDMNIAISASTTSGTNISLPLNNSELIADKDFISFVSKDSTQAVKKTNYFQGLTMTMDLAVNANANAVIYTDLGRLSGNGNGLLSMKISSLGNFEMFGDYTISGGEFEFTAQDFINKKFEINRGGSIRWTGNPKEAQINLTAIYEVRTSVQPLYLAAGRGTGNDQRVMVQAEMVLKGSLMHPEINFGVNFPTDSYIKDEVQTYLSDANNVNQQALSLIVRRSFAPGTGTALTRELNTTVLSAGTELAFNQLNNIISQSLNLNFVDFNIRSFNEASASIRLLSNRLILTGGVTDRRGELNDFNVFGKEVVSDIEALYLIRKDGSLLLRGSNRLNNRNILNPNDEYVSAIGLVYRQEFDTFKEYFKRLLFFGRSKSHPSDNARPAENASSIKSAMSIEEKN